MYCLTNRFITFLFDQTELLGTVYACARTANDWNDIRQWRTLVPWPSDCLTRFGRDIPVQRRPEPFDPFPTELSQPHLKARHSNSLVRFIHMSIQHISDYTLQLVTLPTSLFSDWIRATKTSAISDVYI
jgi:hypothetical protein